jgi:hypothetical protein
MKSATSKDSKAQDKRAKATLADYCARYAVNRPFNSPEVPSLIVAILSGTGREVYNRDGGGTIATFSSTEVARKAIKDITGVWP